MDVGSQTYKHPPLTEIKSFEISLNQNDDLVFVVSHFKSIQVPEIAAQHSLHGLGSEIISEITRNVGRFLPRNRNCGKRKYKITKPIYSNYSKTAKTCARIPENRMASFEIGALQDNHSSGDSILLHVILDILFAN